MINPTRAALVATLLLLVLSSMAPTVATARRGAVDLNLKEAPFSEPRFQGAVDEPIKADLHVSSNGGAAIGGRITYGVPAGVTVSKPDGTPDDDHAFTEADSWTIHITATIPGFHTVNVRATASNATHPVTFPVRIYAAARSPLPATGSLAGRRYASSVSDYVESEETWSYRHNAIWFLDDTFAYVGFPRAGRPTCAAANTGADFEGCVRYRYDKQQQVVKVSHWYAAVSARELGFVAPLDRHRIRFGLAPPGRRYDVTWQAYVGNRQQWRKVRLTLRHNGGFELRTTLSVTKVTVARGRYQVLSGGRIKLTYRSGRSQVRTFGVGLNARGEQHPSRIGVLLSLPNYQGYDGLWLRP